MLNPTHDDQKLLAQVIDYYHKTLKETTEGISYLQKRGITVGEAIDRFRIGYANRTLGLKLPLKQVNAGKEIRVRLQQVGLYRKTGREHFNGCVVFPIGDADGSGQIVDIYGRKTSDSRLRNLFAESLTFLDNKTRARRNHMKYSTLIRALHRQRQYPTCTLHARIGFQTLPIASYPCLK